MITCAPPSVELITFDFWLEPEYWQSPPVVDIRIDHYDVQTVIVDRPMHVSFDRRLDFGYHRLEMKRYGKTDLETRVNDKGGYDTQVLHIGMIKIDRINLRNLLWDRSQFRPVYPEPWASQQRDKGEILEHTIKGEMTLGHNGTWTFDFSSPFYQFVVDCVRTPR